MLKIIAPVWIAAAVSLSLFCCLWMLTEDGSPFLIDSDDYLLAREDVAERFVLDDPERAAELFVAMALSDDDLDGDGVSTLSSYRRYLERIGCCNPRSCLRLIQIDYDYVSDREQYGMFDRAAFPIETIVSGKGDCEDLSILFTALMHRSGYDCGIAVFSDHAVAMVCTDADVSGIYEGYAPLSLVRDGKIYHAFETAGDCPAGYTFSGYRAEDVRAFAVADGQTP